MKPAKSAFRILWAALVLPAALMVSCSASRRDTAPSNPAGAATKREAIPVQTVTVTSGPLVTEHVATGTIVPVTQSNVAAQTSGAVERVDHLAGDWVKTGEVVVKLDDSQARLAVEAAQAALATAQVNVQKAKARLDLAELTLHRDQRLVKQQSIPQIQLDNDSTAAEAARVDYLAAQAATKEAQAQLGQAELSVEHASVRAPFAGQLAAVRVRQGDYVVQGNPIFVLVSRDREIDFEVPPSDAGALQLGTAITFTYEGAVYAAKVSQAPSAPISGVVPMVGRLAAAMVLPYGAVGKVSYPITLGRGAIVPISALQSNGNQDYVYLVKAGKAAMQPLQVMAESGTDAVVSGVPAGAELIVNPPPGLLDGAPVAATELRNG